MASRHRYREELSQAENSIETLTASVALHEQRIAHRRSRHDRERCEEHDRDQELVRLLQEKAAIEDLLVRAQERADRAIGDMFAAEMMNHPGRRVSFDTTRTTFFDLDDTISTTFDGPDTRYTPYYSYRERISAEQYPSYEGPTRSQYEERRSDYARDTMPDRSTYEEPAPRSHRSRYGEHLRPDDIPPQPQHSGREQPRSYPHHRREQEPQPEISRDARQAEPLSGSHRRRREEARSDSHRYYQEEPRYDSRRSGSHRSRQEEPRSDSHRYYQEEPRSDSHRYHQEEPRSQSHSSRYGEYLRPDDVPPPRSRNYSRHEESRSRFELRSGFSHNARQAEPRSHTQREESRSQSHRSRKADSRPPTSSPNDETRRSSQHHKTSSSRRRGAKPSLPSRAHSQAAPQYASPFDILTWYASLTATLSPESIPKLTKFPYPPITPCTTADCTSAFALDRLNPACDCSLKSTFRMLAVEPNKEKRRFHPDKFSAVQDKKKREEIQKAAREVFVVLGGMGK
ncbi:hypothetical protein CERZMDRAFT_86260 [Cercospora zeae-maydis SCOH1-5]|uniref:J domain-containing protein n=1 Tax=Cercospora zeae-maydis SCOH1-5 TaxID=717836 RepID=A0A6A6F9X9_9PEZI|nr:hypothetical protein CERZMDRAFT_86260 [Cercospora zeae-maydis SCOH1-5]